MSAKAKAIRLVDTQPTKQTAEESMFFYAKLLHQRGDTDRFGVFIEHIKIGERCGSWGIYLLDRQYAPTRQAARKRKV